MQKYCILMSRMYGRTLDMMYLINYCNQIDKLSKQENKLKKYIEDYCKLKYNVIPIESLYDDPNKLLNLFKVLPDHGSAREDILKYIK